MDDGWYDEEAGPLVRPYTITSGRTPSPNMKLDVATQVMTIRSETEPTGLGPEHLQIVRQCRQPYSIAEIGVYVNRPLGVVRVLCGDLIDRGLVITRSPPVQVEAPDHELLQAVLNGLSKL